MRRRLVLVIVSTVLATGLLIGIPLVLFAEVGIRERAQSLAQTTAQRTAELIAMRIQQGLPNDAATLGPYTNPGRQTRITFPDGSVENFGTPPGGEVVTGRGRSSGVDVVVRQSTSATASPLRVVGNTVIIIVLAMLLAFVVALRRSRRIADMMDDLATDAARIGSGDMRPARRYGMAELDQVAASLDASALRVSEVVRTERELAADVTHQLRTPLTAIGLRLDEVTDAAERGDLPTVRVEAFAAQEQVDRLTRVIDDLLAASRRANAPTETFGIDDVLRQQREEWAPLFEAAQRPLTVETGSDVDCKGSPGSFAQIVATLLENALVHGGGAVTVAVSDSESLVVIEVRDEGPGIAPQLASSIFERNVSGRGGSGLGLSLARAFAEQMGGRLELVSRWPTVFGLFLPQVDGISSVDGPGAGQLVVPAVDGSTDAVESSSPSAASTVAGNTQRR